MKKVGVSILGLGVVGGGTYRILESHREFFRATQNIDVTVECVLEPNAEKTGALGVPAEKVASNIAEIVANPDVNIIVETIGGVGVAREYVLAALNAGKTVVTSNKELYCKFSHELEHTAKRQNAGLFFEATCVGGVPIVRTLLDGLQANKISSFMGIINGTTNFILTEMAKGTSYADALAEAKKLGYTEADPSADVDGLDASYKLSILSSLAFHTKVPLSKVFREGISSVSVEDIRHGAELGYVLKLLAVGKQTEEGIEVRVHPAFLRKEHPLAAVNGCFNAVYLKGDAAGDMMMYGRGAGDLPTASAIVSDIIYAATHSEYRYSTFKNTEKEEKGVTFIDDFSSAYYVRLSVEDRSGMLAKIGSVLGKAGISINEVVQCGADEENRATVVLVTHETHEYAIRNAVSKLEASIAKVKSVLRVAL